jgi:hypothetical protein
MESRLKLSATAPPNPSGYVARLACGMPTSDTAMAKVTVVRLRQVNGGNLHTARSSKEMVFVGWSSLANSLILPFSIRDVGSISPARKFGRDRSRAAVRIATLRRRT